MQQAEARKEQRQPGVQDALAKVVDEVRVDARNEPTRYLEDSVAPEGGE